MANAKICDRCGCLIQPVGNTHVLDVHKKYCAEFVIESIDLCLDCYEKLEMFLKENKNE